MTRLFKLFAWLCLFVFPATLLAQSEDIAYGESISIVITDETTQHFFNFEGAAGTLIYASVIPDDPAQEVPVYLRLLTDSGLTVAEADNGVLGPALLPQDGGYTLELNRQEWSEHTGTILVLVDETELVRLENYTGTLDATARGAIGFFAFEGNEGDIHQAAANCEDCGMLLFAPSGNVIYNEGGYASPFTPMVYLPESGRYMLWLQNTAEAGTLDVAFPRIEPVALTSNSPVDGMIGDELLYFSFESAAGKVWQINTEIPYTGERLIGIYQPRGREVWEAGLIFDQGSGADSNPRISTFVAPEDATYYVVMRYEAFTAGSQEAYSITLAPDSITRLVLDTPTERTITPETGAQQFSYTGTAGEKLQVFLSKESESGSMSLLVLSSEDEVINVYSRNADFMSFVVTLPLDDTYAFIVSNIDYDTSSDLAFTLELKPGTEE